MFPLSHFVSDFNKVKLMRNPGTEKGRVVGQSKSAKTKDETVPVSLNSGFVEFD